MLTLLPCTSTILDNVSFQRMVGTKMVKQPSLGPLSPPRYQDSRLTRTHSTAKFTFYEHENVTEMAIRVSASPLNSIRDTFFSAV